MMKVLGISAKFGGYICDFRLRRDTGDLDLCASIEWKGADRLRFISTAASFPQRKGASRVVAIYLSKNAVRKGNDLAAFTLITKTSVVEVWSRIL